MGFCPFWGVRWRATEADYWEKTRVAFNFGSQRESSLGRSVIAISQTVADIARRQYYQEFFVEMFFVRPPPCWAPMRRSLPWSFESRNHQPPLSSDKSRKTNWRMYVWGWWSTANEICTKWDNPIINVFPPNTELEIPSQNINLIWSGQKMLFLEHEFCEQCNCFLIVREFDALN